MESVGKRLREGREQNNYSIEQVARDTHISKQYLLALEEENFSIIPGETYITGFLRNYSEYLSLNPDEMVNLYKSLKIQEQPLPMDELLETKSRRLSVKLILLILLIVLLVGGAGFGGYLILSVKSADRAEPEQDEAALQTEEKKYLFQEEVLTRWFNQGEMIEVPVSGGMIDLNLISITEKLTLEVLGENLDFNIGESRSLDLDGNSRVDLRILLNDIDRSEEIARVNLGLYKVTRQSVQAADGDASIDDGMDASMDASIDDGMDASAEAGVEGVAESTETGGRALPVIESEKKAVVILKAAEPAPFRISINFRGFCLFRYLVDDKTREERFFHKGESFSLDVKNQAKLWMSNSGVLRVMIAGRDVEMGKPGEVATRIVRWNKDAEGYSLEITPAD
jgi:cytoskeleton protein RodZ